MRLLERKPSGNLVLREFSVDALPPYAILSHTWLADNEEEVTFQDVEAGAGYIKAGWKKIHFCANKAAAEVLKGNTVNNVQSTWEPSLRNSRWFTRGWTLQELLAPDVVDFFSCEGELLGTKQTLAQLIHEITTLPLAALAGTSLTQFPIDEKIRWTKKRQTKKLEDRAYCLLGIFNVFMPLIYGEGDNALFRLREEINKKFGNNVAASLGVVDEVGSVGLRRRPAPPDDVNNPAGGASDSDEMVQVSRSGALRPAKRVKTSYDPNVLEIQQSDNDAQPDAMIISEDKYNDLLKSLLFDRIDFRVNNVKKALLSTCEWLFRHPHFQTWCEKGGSAQPSGFLWIKGKPGCGKSTLMKALLEWARKRKSKDRVRQTIVPYFFHARAAASLEKSSLGLYRTVVHHLLSSCPSLRTLFAEKFALKDPGQLGENWTVEELQDFLFDAVKSNESFGLCLLIDALDEAEYEPDVRNMISFLARLSDPALATGSASKLRVCLSSRHYPHIHIKTELSLVVEDQPEHGQDIDHYITKELTCHDGPEKSELRAEILQKSAGIFLWVDLVVKIMNQLDDHGASLSDMKARLENIPAGPKQLFQEILTKSDVGTETTMLFFQWTAFCMRPLEPAELYVAMESSKSPDDMAHISRKEIPVPVPERLARNILNWSRGLVEIVEAGPSQAATVQFIHETVREFLLKENGLGSFSRDLAANVDGISHDILGSACLRYMSMTDMPDEYKPYCAATHKTNAYLEVFRTNMRERLPFLDYAISHLFHHAEQAQRHDISQHAFLKSQIDVNGVWLDQYRLWWNVLERYKRKKVKVNTTLIYFVAQQKHATLLAALLTLSNAINMPNRYLEYGSILQMASYYGSQEIVQLLLDKGVDVNTPAGTYDEALPSASTGGHEKVVQMLLKAGANLNPDMCGRALQLASQRGHEKVVQMLIKAGANLNLDMRGRALQLASMNGHEKVVHLLIKASADSDSFWSGAALEEALEGGHEKVVQMLLKASVGSNPGLYVRVLNGLTFGIRGKTKALKMLLKAGADLGDQERSHGEAIYRASSHGPPWVVQLLLEAIYRASSHGPPWVVQLLLEATPDIDTRGYWYRSAMKAAKGRSHDVILQLLRDRCPWE